MLARNILAETVQQANLALWDIDPLATQSLTAKFGSQANIINGEAQISDAAVSDADFIFIDPPGLRSQRFIDFPSWNYLASFMTLASDQLIWLPIVDNRKMKPDAETSVVRETALCMGLSVTEIRWKGRNMVGCQLLYRVPDTIGAELQRVLTWATGFFSNCSIEHYPDLRG